MKNRLFLIPLLILALTLLLGYQVDVFSPSKVNAMDVTIFENNHGPNYNTLFTTNTRWLSQTFTPEVSHTIKSVKLRIGKAWGIRPVLYVYICPTGVDGKPLTGEVLAYGYHYFPKLSSWSGWQEVSLGDGTLLQAGVTYSIVIWANAKHVNSFYWTYSRDYYAGGHYYYSTDSGATWTGSTGFDMHFEEWGILPPQEPQIFENYNNTTAVGAIIYEPYQCGQTFIPQTRHILSKLYLNGYVPFRTGAQLIVKIMSTSNGLPTGEPLATVSIPNDLLPLPGQGYWISVDIPDEPELQAGVMYAIVLAQDVSEPFGYRWITDWDDENGDYPNGTLVSSTSSGITWNIDPDHDCCFQEWGYPLE